jgi:hypothetical protein
LLSDNGILPPGWDPSATASTNALMENAFLRLEDRTGVPRSWRTRDEAENAIVAYIDGLNNTERFQLVSVAGRATVVRIRTRSVPAGRRQPPVTASARQRSVRHPAARAAWR